MPLRLRRGTDTERLSITPLQGELIYTIDTKEVWIGDGSTQGGIKITGDIPESINDLNDVDIVSTLPQTGYVLKWDGTHFIPQPDVDTTLNLESISDLPDVDINTVLPEIGQTLVWDGSNFIPSYQAIKSDLAGSVFADDSTMIIDGVAGKIVGPVTIGNLSELTFETDQDPNTWTDGSISATGYAYQFNFPTNQSADTAPLMAGWNDYSYIQPFLPTDIGPTEGTQGFIRRTLELRAGDATETRAPGILLLNGGSNSSAGLYGEVRINTTAGDVKIGSSTSTTTISGDVDFNDVIKFAKTTTTGADDNPTLTLIDVNSSGVQVLTSNNNDTNNWELPDGSEGQIMHFVAGGAGGSGANHKIKINNWWQRDGATGVWSSGSGYWDVFAIYGFAGRTDTGMATAIFVDGAWRTTSPWTD